MAGRCCVVLVLVLLNVEVLRLRGESASEGVQPVC
jgi:hypothetical protein